ncbi:MAG: phage capsid protein [Candidatus Gracilibacteria bacterium]|jgi:N4-gp56 family major capsid protein|nr:phage capsid protein [Candidatus Gracilibacteria bacterium]
MSNNITSLNAEAWSSVLQEVLRERFIGKEIANTKFEGNFDGTDKVHFPKMSKITVQNLSSSYDSPAPQDLTVTDEQFVLNQRKAWAVKLSEEDVRQMKVSPNDQFIADAAESFAKAYDDAILSQYLNAEHTADAALVGGTSGDGASLTKDNIYQFIIEIGRLLDEANVPQTDRFIILSPKEKALLLQSPALVRSTKVGDKTIVSGEVGTVDNFTIYCSNNLKKASDIRHALAGGGRPVCFAANIKPKVQITPPEYRDDFVYLFKSQTKFGVKTFTEGANRLVDVKIAE